MDICYTGTHPLKVAPNLPPDLQISGWEEDAGKENECWGLRGKMLRRGREVLEGM